MVGMIRAGASPLEAPPLLEIRPMYSKLLSQRFTMYIRSNILSQKFSFLALLGVDDVIHI